MKKKNKNKPSVMKQLYSLLLEIEQHPEWVQRAQEVTLDPEYPETGLSDRYGLYGSELWIDNLKNGVMPQKIVAGVIVGIGTHGWGYHQPNAINIKVDGTGEIISEGMWLNVKSQKKYYRGGKRVEIGYYLPDYKYYSPETIYSMQVYQLSVEV